MKTIAIICDCDNTLMPDAPSLLLKDNGINPQDFWNSIDVLVKDGWDPPIAWMTKLVKLIKDGKIKQNTNAKLRNATRKNAEQKHQTRNTKGK